MATEPQNGNHLMLYPELRDQIANGTINVGDDVWIVDFRYEDVLNKPIRNVTPTLVRITSNDDLPARKTVYYADYHFRPLGKNGAAKATVIAPYDNTGFRGYTGVSVNIFLTEAEAQARYQEQIREAREQIVVARERSDARFVTLLLDVEERSR
jgi:hypothetical protein